MRRDLSNPFENRWQLLSVHSRLKRQLGRRRLLPFGSCPEVPRRSTLKASTQPCSSRHARSCQSPVPDFSQHGPGQGPDRLRQLALYSLHYGELLPSIRHCPEKGRARWLPRSDVSARKRIWLLARKTRPSIFLQAFGGFERR